MSITLADKVEEASKYALLLNHDKPFEHPRKIIWEGLSKLGIFNDEISYEILMSPSCKEGDARAIFCDEMGMPVPRFRKIWKILKDDEKEESSEFQDPNLNDTMHEIVKTLRHVGQLSNKELLESYKENPNNSVVESELQKRSKDGNCIAFFKDEIDVDLSTSLIAKAKRGIKVPIILNKNGKIYRIRPVGKFPNEICDICPVTGAILFDDYSEKLGVTWDIPLEVRKFVWLMNDQGVHIDAFVANNIQELYKNKGFDTLKSQYPKIAELFDDLSDINGLPTLKTLLSTEESKNIDPFRGNRRF